MLLTASNKLAGVCGWLAEVFQEAERQLNRCPECGRSRFYGKACK